MENTESTELTFQNNHDFITVFENRLSEFTGAPFVILTDRCTNAIFLALKYLKLKNRKVLDFNYKKITIPKRTYLSVPKAIIMSGFKVDFECLEWNEKYQLKGTPVYDCAVGFKPNMYRTGEIQCISFGQKKALKINKGGAILTDDIKMYDFLKRMSHDGRDGSIPASIEITQNSLDLIGYHMNMTPEEAAKGILQLNQLSSKEIEDNLGSYINYPDISHFDYEGF